MPEYRVTLNCLVTWFGIESDSARPSPLLRSATFTRLTSEVANENPIQPVDYVPFSDLSIIGPNCSVTYSVDSGVFMAALRLELFGEERKQELALQANSRVPFLLQVRQGSQIDWPTPVFGTAAAFQGVFVTGGILTPGSGKHLPKHR